MSAPFEPGDVVVCVDDRTDDEWSRYFAWHGLRYILPERGKVYRISEVLQNRAGRWGVLLQDFPVQPMPTGEEAERHGWAAERFRKIHDDVTDEFREQLRKLPVLEPAL